MMTIEVLTVDAAGNQTLELREIPEDYFQSAGEAPAEKTEPAQA